MWTLWDQDRWYSGPIGSRALVSLHPSSGNYDTYSFFSLHPGEYPSSFGRAAPQPFSNLLHPYDPITMTARLSRRPPRLREEPLQRLLPAGQLQPQRPAQPDRQRRRSARAAKDVRLPRQRLPRHRRTSSPRLAPSTIRSTTAAQDSVSYGRYYEAVPLDVAARYFGGEDILVHQGGRSSSCATPNHARAASRTRYNWTAPASTRSAVTADWRLQPDFNNELDYPCRPTSQGQYHNEVVGHRGAPDHRGHDGAPRLPAPLAREHHRGRRRPPRSQHGVLANPGHVPESAIEAAKNEATQADATRDGQPERSVPLQAAAANAQAKLGTLQSWQRRPSPSAPTTPSPSPSTSASPRTGWRAPRTPTRA